MSPGSTLTGAGTGDDGEAQGVSRPTEDLSELPVRQSHHRASLHRLQTISRPDLTTLGGWAASPDRHEPMREERSSWKEERKSRVGTSLKTERGEQYVRSPRPSDHYWQALVQKCLYTSPIILETLLLSSSSHHQLISSSADTLNSSF